MALYTYFPDAVRNFDLCLYAAFLASDASSFSRAIFLLGAA